MIKKYQNIKRYICIIIYIYIYNYANIYETSQDQMRLKSDTFISSFSLIWSCDVSYIYISSYRQKMTGKSFSGRFGVFAYTNSKCIQL